MTPPATSWVERHRRLLWGTAGTAAAVYAGYIVYNSKTAKAISDSASALSSLGDTASLLTADIQTFLNSDGDEVPRSLGQLAKLLRSAQVQEVVQAVSASVTQGVSQGLSPDGGAGGGSSGGGPSALDKVLEAVLSDRGRSLVGLAVGIAAKNATGTFCEYLQGSGAFAPPAGGDGAAEDGGGGAPAPPRPPAFGPREMLALLASPDGERLLRLLISETMRTGVSTYCGAYAGYNVYNDMLDAIGQPAHQEAVATIFARVASAIVREAGVAYRKSGASPPANSSTHSAPASSSGAAFAAPHGSGDHSARLTNGSGSGGGGNAVVLVGGGALAPAAGNHLGRSPSSTGELVAHAPQQQRLNAAARAAAAASGPAAGGGDGARPPWVAHVAALASEPAFRSLLVEVSCSVTKHGVREVWQGLVAQVGQVGGALVEGAGEALGLQSMGSSRMSHLMIVLMLLAMLLPRMVG